MEVVGSIRIFILTEDEMSATFNNPYGAICPKHNTPFETKEVPEHGKTVDYCPECETEMREFMRATLKPHVTPFSPLGEQFFREGDDHGNTIR